MPLTSEFAVDDYLAIQHLMYEFNRCFDEGDADGFVRLFATDAIVDLPAGACHNEAELRHRVFASMGRNAHLHVTTNVVILPDPEDNLQASARSSFMYMEVGDRGVEIRGIGRYDDRFAKRDGLWLFLSRLGKLSEGLESRLRDLIEPNAANGLTSDR
jgi:hypothetical protein